MDVTQDTNYSDTGSVCVPETDTRSVRGKSMENSSFSVGTDDTAHLVHELSFNLSAEI